MNLSSTSEKILAIFFANPGRKLYVNELIRQTGQYPNSIQQALKSLEKQKILVSERTGRFNFYHLNDSFSLLKEVRGIICKKYPRERSKVNIELEQPTKSSQEWVKLLNREASLAFHDTLCVSNAISLKKTHGITVPTFWYNNVTFGVYYIKDELLALAKEVTKKIEKDSDFAKKDIVLCRKVCGQLVKFSKKLFRIDYSQKSKKELEMLLKKFYHYYLAVFPFVTTPHAIERYFETKIREEVVDEEALEILLSPISADDEERDSALKIAAYAKRNGFNQKYGQLLTKHGEGFCWFPLWSIWAEPLNKDYFDKEIKNILERIENPEKELKSLKKEYFSRKEIFMNTLKGIKSSHSLTNRVLLLQEYIGLRTFRKNAISQAHYYHLPLLLEIAVRLRLTKEEIKLLSYEEIIQGLAGKISLNTIRKLVKDRQAGWGILMLDGRVEVISGVKNIIETMERYQIFAPGTQMVKTVKGSPACLGKATGRVKVVRKISELGKVEKGDILVAKMTTPDYMMAIHRAVAIVTDEGGITCHAAIVSREFNIPCIVATKNATQVLSDGDLVEVNADEGVVRVIEAVEAPEDIKVLSGKTIYRGKVRGTARIVLSAADFGKIKEGDILITAQTTPEYLSSLYRVKGFVADEDSLTSHAVLYGQALKLPSIMGTGFARNVIKDGEKIELDASRGLVRRLDLS